MIVLIAYLLGVMTGIAVWCYYETNADMESEER